MYFCCRTGLPVMIDWIDRSPLIGVLQVLVKDTYRLLFSAVQNSIRPELRCLDFKVPTRRPDKRSGGRPLWRPCGVRPRGKLVFAQISALGDKSARAAGRGPSGACGGVRSTASLTFLKGAAFFLGSLKHGRATSRVMA